MSVFSKNSFLESLISAIVFLVSTTYIFCYDLYFFPFTYIKLHFFLFLVPLSVITTIIFKVVPETLNGKRNAKGMVTSVGKEEEKRRKFKDC